MYTALFWLLLLSCQSEPTPGPTPNVDMQGHRGARGLFPENSIEGFKAALDLGVHTLEMDLCISRDGYVIVSHEPWMNANICVKPDGEFIPKELQLDYKLFEMSKDAIQKYDCGSLGNPRFAQQQKIKTYKPTLEEVVLATDEHARASNRALPKFNLEIKRSKGQDGIFHPDFQFFVYNVMHVVQKMGIEDRTIIQSFDLEVLEDMKKVFPEQPISLLVSENEGIFDKLKQLTVKPDFISPHFSLLDEKTIEALHNDNYEVIPWTVNKVSDIKRMMEVGVDGIISDYPDRLAQIIKSNSN